MIAKPPPRVSQKLNIDLSNVPLAEMDGLLDAVSIESFLDYAFKVLLHRSPDSAGAVHYRQRILAGNSRPSVVCDLLASGEFKDRHGAKHRRAQPIEEFVNQTYQDILGRWPDEDGRQTYMRIGRKWRGRAKVERNILNSPEAWQTGGSRLARIQALQAYAAQSRWLKLPMIGTRLRRHNEMVARLVRIERLMAVRGDVSGIQKLITPTGSVPGHDLAGLIEQQAAPPPLDATHVHQPMLREARIDTLDSATASKLETDGWVFRVAVRDARRKEVARTNPASARN